MTKSIGRRTVVIFAAGFIIVTAGFLARNVSGYALEGPKWANSPVMRLSLGNAGRTLIDGNTSWDNAAVPALDMWNQVISRIQLGRVFNPFPQPARQDGINSIGFSNNVFGQSWPPNAYAVTVMRYSGTTLLETDILFNSTKTWDSYRGPLRFSQNGQLRCDIQRVAVHELGHAIGLDHPDDIAQYVEAIMNSIISDRYTLSADDIAGAQHLYGAGVPLRSNILAQNSSTGQRQIWVTTYSSGFVNFFAFNLVTLSTQWNIVASADFNRNGSLDIVWQNSSSSQSVVWYMNGTNHIGGAILPTPPPNWQIASAGDFNGDNKPDLILQNMSTGQRMLWLMNGATHIGSWNLGTLPPAWKITGSADFNGDGKTDILWQNNVTGLRTIWLMNGTQLIGNASLGTFPTFWDIVGTGDFNRDGKPDIILQHQTYGRGATWLMNGTTRIGVADLRSIGPEWQIRNY